MQQERIKEILIGLTLVMFLILLSLFVIAISGDDSDYVITNSYNNYYNENPKVVLPVKPQTQETYSYQKFPSRIYISEGKHYTYYDNDRDYTHYPAYDKDHINYHTYYGHDRDSRYYRDYDRYDYVRDRDYRDHDYKRHHDYKYDDENLIIKDVYIESHGDQWGYGLVYQSKPQTKKTSFYFD